MRLSLHRDDPPLPAMRDVPRIFSSVPAYCRVLGLYPSRANAVTLCQGNFALMTDDLPSVIRKLGGRNAVAFVHFRDVAGTADDFIETFHDEGQTDLEACMGGLRRGRIRRTAAAGPRPHPVRRVQRPAGYATLGRLFALGYIRALRGLVSTPVCGLPAGGGGRTVVDGSGWTTWPAAAPPAWCLAATHARTQCSGSGGP